MSALLTKSRPTPAQFFTKWLGFTVIFALMIGVVNVPMMFRSLDKVKAQRDQAKDKAHELVRAIDRYRTIYHAEPPANNAQLVKVLAGDNPQKIAFLTVRKPDGNKQGALVDPWGLPYLIEAQEGKSWRIWSCGQDRIDDQGSEKSDDITSWSAK